MEEHDFLVWFHLKEKLSLTYMTNADFNKPDEQFKDSFIVINGKYSTEIEYWSS